MTTMSTVEMPLFREGVADLPDRAIAYRECGAGRPIVLLHGYTDSWRTFRLVLPALGAYGRCLVFDLRGHGDSNYTGNDYSVEGFVADVVGFIESLRLGPVALIGHSMGSLIARQVALTRPDVVERLVLVGAPLRMETPAAESLAAEVAAFDTAIPREFAEDFLHSCVFDRRAVPEWFIDDCVSASLRLPLRVWQDVLAGLLAVDHGARLAEIDCATLVVGGRDDAFFSAEDQMELARALPRGRLLLYDRVGHCPNWERPVRFVRDVAEFLASPE